MPTVEPAARSGDPAVRRRFSGIVEAWPLRKVVAVVVLFPVLFALLAGTTGGWAPRSVPGWTALVAAVALVGATTLATYLPRPGIGRGLDVGCTPCAALAAFSLLAAGAILRSEQHDVPTAILALGIAGFGLSQRLANPSTCPTG